MPCLSVPCVFLPPLGVGVALLPGSAVLTVHSVNTMLEDFQVGGRGPPLLVSPLRHLIPGAMVLQQSFLAILRNAAAASDNVEIPVDRIEAAFENSNPTNALFHDMDQDG